MDISGESVVLPVSFLKHSSFRTKAYLPTQDRKRTDKKVFSKAPWHFVSAQYPCAFGQGMNGLAILSILRSYFFSHKPSENDDGKKNYGPFLSRKIRKGKQAQITFERKQTKLFIAEIGTQMLVCSKHVLYPWSIPRLNFLNDGDCYLNMCTG